MKRKELAGLTTDQLIWSMALRLNHLHSVGGRSIGRSIASVLVEIILNYGTHYQVLDGVDNDSAIETCTWVFIREAKKRQAKKLEPILFRQLTPWQATDRQLIQIAASKMSEYYRTDRKRPDPINDGEYKLAMQIVRLLRPNFGCRYCYRYPDRAVEEIRIAWKDREDEWLENTERSLYNQALRNK